MFDFRKAVLIIALLVLTGPSLVFSQQKPNLETSNTDVADALPGAETDSEAPANADENTDKKTKDPNRGRFLPIPIFITEPAVGEGLGVAVAYFHRPKKSLTGQSIASPGSIGDASKKQTPPPTVTGVFAAYTTNETKAAGIGHINSFKDDHIRFTGVAVIADVKSTFFLLDRPFKFNLDGILVYQDTRFRFRDSQWFWGIGLSYLNANNAFQIELPNEVPLDLFPTNLSNIGLSAKVAWDTRDNTSMPNSGHMIDLAVWRYDQAIGGDFDYWNATLKLLSFHSLHDKFVLGFRLEYSTIEGDAPFFAIPWVSLRGIAAMRYQGDRVAVGEIEARYNFTPRWAMIAFGGTGAVSSNNDIIDTEQKIYAFGLGGRYQIFEAQNIWVGIDIARGPEDTNWYIQVGHAW